MAAPFIGDMRMFGGDFAPRNFAQCDGQEIEISNNQALFSIIGTAFGGDGQTKFRLPDMKGRIPIHIGQRDGSKHKYKMGQMGGREGVKLKPEHLPTHQHQMKISAENATTTDPANNMVANPNDNLFFPYTKSKPKDPMSNDCVSNTGGGKAHNNMMPSLGVNFIIALRGEMPERS